MSNHDPFSSDPPLVSLVESCEFNNHHADPQAGFVVLSRDADVGDEDMRLQGLIAAEAVVAVSGFSAEVEGRRQALFDHEAFTLSRLVAAEQEVAHNSSCGTSMGINGSFNCSLAEAPLELNEEQRQAAYDRSPVVARTIITAFDEDGAKTEKEQLHRIVVVQNCSSLDCNNNALSPSQLLKDLSPKQADLVPIKIDL